MDLLTIKIEITDKPRSMLVDTATNSHSKTSYT